MNAKAARHIINNAIGFYTLLLNKKTRAEALQTLEEFDKADRLTRAMRAADAGRCLQAWQNGEIGLVTKKKV